MDCAGAIRADPKKKLLTQDLRCEEDVQAKLTNDRLLQEKVEAEMMEARSDRVKYMYRFSLSFFFLRVRRVPDFPFNSISIFESSKQLLLLITMYLEAGRDGTTTSAFLWGPEMYEKHIRKMYRKGEHDAAIKASLERFHSGVCIFLKQGASESVIASGGVGQMQYQSEGSRLVAMMNTSECMEVFGENLEDGQTDCTGQTV